MPILSLAGTDRKERETEIKEYRKSKHSLMAVRNNMTQCIVGEVVYTTGPFTGTSYGPAQIS